ncbi:MAG: hypothetical protein DRR16_15475 [Candidatus Parabeggiatoa sp. nov. 3]|nr:MAG: hypothetical protein DRR00_30845 [Gammaproteobacteria bacterium]RKZ59912.1 MAG: hypothetical protein DRQ99_22970 [Gammaproteobacteria bacterium]RKZ84152.1 MAG: hypothetical protein DRR16_15475 [Gammaproteobacteria bacterium]HEW98624.1 hypothetical protein [Beggiatoa sp.]
MAQQIEPPKIIGYRDLSRAEVELMNLVKTTGAEIGDLVTQLAQNAELDQRWIEIGKTHIQQGLMALTRGITQPDFF